MTKLATVSPVHGLVRTLEPPKGDINGFLRPSMGIIPRGAIMGRRAGSRLLEPVLDSSARSDLEIIGCLDMDTIPAFTDVGTNGEAVDSDGLSIQVRLRDGALGAFDTGTGINAIDKYSIGLPCFAKNDNTLYLTNDAETLSFAGIISGVSADGKIELATDWRIRALLKSFDNVPAMQAVDATLVLGTATVNTGITVAASSEVIVYPKGAITVTANFAMTRELFASRVVGAAGVGTVVVEAITNGGVLDSDAAGAVRIVILTPKS